MKKLKYLLLLWLFILSKIGFAQNTHFIQNGVIEFEKRSNMHAIIKKKINTNNESYYTQLFDSYKKNNPQFKVSKSKLSFSKNKSLYSWLETEETITNNWLANDPFVDLKNTILTNFDTQTSITNKKVYENSYLVTDSVRKINWKITDETREIAGFECRRANAIIMDSVYVVAYYTNEIAVSGGPESLTGLPGMILGFALPHENMTWFATKVTEVNVPEKDLTAPAKGKPVNNTSLNLIFQKAMKDWGEYGKSQLKVYEF